MSGSENLQVGISISEYLSQWFKSQCLSMLRYSLAIKKNLSRMWPVGLEKTGWIPNEVVSGVTGKHRDRSDQTEFISVRQFDPWGNLPSANIFYFFRLFLTCRTGCFEQKRSEKKSEIKNETKKRNRQWTIISLSTRNALDRSVNFNCTGRGRENVGVLDSIEKAIRLHLLFDSDTHISWLMMATRMIPDDLCNG